MFQKIKNYFTKKQKTSTPYRGSSSSYEPLDVADTMTNMTLSNLHSVDVSYSPSKSCCSDAIAESFSSDGGDCGGCDGGGG
jgi:hypothetical protein